MTGHPDFLIEKLSPFLFWDVDRGKVDPQRHANFLIRRVVDRGTSEDVRSIWSHYGPERVREALVNARSLDRRTIAFFANQFGIPRERFRAYQRSEITWPHRN